MHPAHVSEFDKAITFNSARALVLGGPGCGKTHLLSLRAAHAHFNYGIDFSQMLCLTFTNRAAREMRQRIEGILGVKPETLFVGNIHRFCAVFLAVNHLLPPDASILDDDERDEWFAKTLGVSKRYKIDQITNLADKLFQDEHSFPLLLKRRIDFECDEALRNAAASYREYKEMNGFVDFNDLLLLAFLALNSSNGKTYRHSSYKWLQVDEVQDLSPLQLAIVERLVCVGESTVVYFGDEQQSIFGFAGGGGPAIEKLKRECAHNVITLTRNFRAPEHLAALCRDYATLSLGVAQPEGSPNILAKQEPERDNGLELMKCSAFQRPDAVAALLRKLTANGAKGTTAVLTRTNEQAENLSRVLFNRGIEHVLIARSDLFKSKSYKVLCSHLSVLASCAQKEDWIRLMRHAKSVSNRAEAQSCLVYLTSHGLGPLDFLKTDSAVGNAVESNAVRSVFKHFNGVYGRFYCENVNLTISKTSDFVEFVDCAYNHLLNKEFIVAIPRWQDVLELLGSVICQGMDQGPVGWLAEMRTLTETDLLFASTSRQNITLTTIHKAKGAEFDNVVLYDASPALHHGNDESRVFYVAMSRAKKRLAVFYGDTLSPLLTNVSHHFNIIPPEIVEASALIERMHNVKERKPS